MSEYKVNFKFKDGILHVHLSGEFPNELLHKLKNLFQPLVDACSEYNCNKALIDARDVQINFGTMNMFKAGEDASNLTRFGLRISLLAREDMIDAFFNDVLINRGGFNVGVFTEMNAALEWLKK